MLSQEAERAGITIDQRSIPLKELQACMLAGSHLIIALVDKRRLCGGLMWSRPNTLQIGGVNRIPAICGYGDAYTGSPPVSRNAGIRVQLGNRACVCAWHLIPCISHVLYSNCF